MEQVTMERVQFLVSEARSIVAVARDALRGEAPDTDAIARSLTAACDRLENAAVAAE